VTRREDADYYEPGREERPRRGHGSGVKKKAKEKLAFK